MQAQAKNPSGGLKEQEVKDIFGNIKTIYGGNQLLLKDIQERLSDWDVNKTQLGDIFIRMSPWFKVYIQVRATLARMRLAPCHCNAS